MGYTPRRMIKAAQQARVQAKNPLEIARNVLTIEADAVRGLIERLDERFVKAVELIDARKGRVVVSGMGKSGHIARKIASTLASTGTPAYFVHPAEASHGDLGMVSEGDVFVAISYSGTRQALVHVADVMRKGEDVAQVRSGASARQAVAEMTRGRTGMTAVLDGEGI